MSELLPSGDSSKSSNEIDQVVEEVVAEAHLDTSALKAEDREYLKEHALKKPM